MTTRRYVDPYTMLVRTEELRARLHRVVDRIPLDPDRPIRVVIDDPLPGKSRDQEKKYHAQIGDIARQFRHAGHLWAVDDMKRILIDQFRRDTMVDPEIRPLWASMGVMEMAPAIDGSGMVVLGVQSKKFPAKLAGLFIEWLQAFGDGIGVEWTEN